MSNSLYLDRYRVYTKPEYVTIYQRLKGLVFNEHHNLFSLCVFLGYKNKRCPRMTTKKEIFWSQTFSPHELAAFYALLVRESESGKYTLLKDGEKALEWLQDYASGGMEILLESDILKKFITKRGDELEIIVTLRDNLQKQMMYYVFSEYLSQRKLS